MLISTSSIPSGNPASTRPLDQGVAVSLFPAFKRIWIHPPYTPAAAELVLRRHLQPHELHPAHNVLPEEAKQNLTRTPKLETDGNFVSVSTIHHPVIFICGHHSRDSRCGIMGPLLAYEFQRQLRAVGLVSTQNRSKDSHARAVAVELVSHLGGHKWAGNVIVYLPAGRKLHWNSSGLDVLPMEQAYGIWYGRVEPRHVEGIIKETLVGGTVIEELFRGIVRGRKSQDECSE